MPALPLLHGSVLGTSLVSPGLWAAVGSQWIRPPRCPGPSTEPFPTISYSLTERYGLVLSDDWVDWGRPSPALCGVSAHTWGAHRSPTCMSSWAWFCCLHIQGAYLPLRRLLGFFVRTTTTPELIQYNTPPYYPSLLESPPFRGAI